MSAGHSTVVATDWDRAKAAYLAAKRAEDWYDENVSMPALNGDMTAALPDSVAAECDRLLDERTRAEDRLMDVPSPHPVAFAVKHLIAHGDGRETDCWDDMLEAEARRFADTAEARQAIVVDQSAWDAAIANRDRVYAEWQIRQAAFGRAEDAFFADRNPTNEAEYDRTDAENDRFSALDDAARLHLNNTPAPDLLAAIYKLEHASEWGLPIVSAIADLRRLAKLEG